MRYKARSIAALQLALGSLPDKMRVEVDPGIEVSAKTVGELRKIAAWPENLVVATPQDPGHSRGSLTAKAERRLLRSLGMRTATAVSGTFTPHS